MTPRVLLLGAGGNAGCNFVRALRMAGPAFVVGVDIDKYNLAACNSDTKVLLRHGGGAKLGEVLAACREHDVQVVHAQPDAEVRWLIAFADEIRAAGFEVFPHRPDLWRTFADKLACQRAWTERLGLGFRCVRLPDLIEGRAPFDFERAWIRAICGAGSRAALPVTSLDQAIAWARYWVETRGMSLDDFMVADYLPGREYAVQTLWINGRLVQSQARERLVYFFGGIMPSGQSSTPAVAATVHERDVYDTAYAAIRAISPEPHGIHCVDLKRDAAGRVVPLEVNYGRFFTTSDFFAALGVNGPASYVAAALGETPPEQIETVRDRHLWLRGIDRAPVLLDGDAA